MALLPELSVFAKTTGHKEAGPRMAKCNRSSNPFSILGQRSVEARFTAVRAQRQEAPIVDGLHDQNTGQIGQFRQVAAEEVAIDGGAPR